MPQKLKVNIKSFDVTLQTQYIHKYPSEGHHFLNLHANLNISSIVEYTNLNGKRTIKYPQPRTPVGRGRATVYILKHKSQRQT